MAKTKGRSSDDQFPVGGFSEPIASIPMIQPGELTIVTDSRTDDHGPLRRSPMTDEERRSLKIYVAMKPCGCVVAAAVDNPEHKKDTAKDIAKWVRDGLTIQRLDKLPEGAFQCPHKEQV